MLKNYILIIALAISSGSAQSMEITAQITQQTESYIKKQEAFTRIVHLDKKQGTYTAVKYWDADCITNEPNPKETFLKLKAAYQAQQQRELNETSEEIL